MKIKTRLVILFLLGSLVPLALASIVFFFTGRGLVAGQILRRLDLHANFAESWIVSAVDDYGERLHSVASVPQLTSALAEYSKTHDPESAAMLAKLLRFAELSIPGLSELILYDANGELVSQSGVRPPNPALQNFPYLDRFPAQGASDRAAALVREGPGGFAFHVSAPVRSEGETLGYVLIVSDLSALAELAKRSIALGPVVRENVTLAGHAGGGAFAVTFTSGNEPPLARALPSANGQSPIELALGGQELTVKDIRDEDGRAVFAVTRYIPSLDAGLVLTVDRAEVFAPLRTVTTVVLGLSALMLIVALLMARVIADKLTEPIKGLMSAVKRLEAGDLETHLPSQNVDEFEQLALAFNGMTEQLKQSKAALVGEVARAREQEHRNRAIIASSLDAVVAMDQDGRVSDWNPAAEQLFGFSREEALGRELAELIVPAGGVDPAIDFGSLCLQQNPSVVGKRIEMIALCRDGVRRPIELVVTETEIADRLTYTCFIRDLTDEKRAALQGLWYGSILKNSHDGIVGTDLESRIILWNAAAERIFGFTASEAIGQPIDIIVPDDRLAEERTAFERLSRGADVEAIDTVRCRKNGEPIDVSLSISPIIGENGQFIGAAKIVRDISKRRAEEKRFQLVVEAAPTAMVVIGPRGAIELVNAHAERLFGYTREELLGKPFEQIVPEPLNGRTTAKLGDFLDQAGAGRLVKGRDVFARKKDGAKFPVEIGLNPVTTEKGPLVLGSIVDISERKQTENFIRNSLREKEVLLKEIHHRVKNNLQVISSLLRLQAEYLPDEQSKALFKQCDARVRSMALIHERLYRSEGFSEIDLSDYIKELASSLIRSYAVRSSKVALETDLQHVRLGIDKAIPCGLLLNEFISNALKHAFEPGAAGLLSIKLSENEHEVTLVVEDNGKGLPKNWDMNKSATLGFQIVRTLIEQLSGRLEIERNHGTKLTLVFEREASQSEKRRDDGQHLGV